MIYPTALAHFVANSFYCVTPLYANTLGGGSATKHRNEQTLQPSVSVAKHQCRSSAVHPRRTSPRTQNKNRYATPSTGLEEDSEQQRCRLGRGTNLNAMPPLYEIKIHPDNEDDLSVNLLTELPTELSLCGAF
jgi:hypothetical protein